MDTQNKPTPLLLELLSLTHIQHDNSLESIIKATQQPIEKGGWLRSTGNERWDLLNKRPDPRIMEIMRQLGFIDAIAPTQKHYDYAVIFGSTATDLRQRLAYLIELHNTHALQFDNLIFLVGQRQRSITIETDQMLFDPTISCIPFKKGWTYNGPPVVTETDIAHVIYDQSELPKNWYRIPTYFIDTPMQKNAAGVLVRPITANTLKMWTATIQPKPGKTLLISSQPHIHRQRLNAYAVLPPTFYIEGVGGPLQLVHHSEHYLLDAIARSLYEIYIYLQK